jgi:hypothetical protein
MYFFQKFLGDRAVSASLAGGTDVSVYASTYTSGQVGVALINTSTNPKAIEIKVKNFRPGNRFYWYALAGGSDNGEFSRKVFVNGRGPDYISGGPSNYSSLPAYSSPATNGIRVTVPARGVVFMVIDKK